MKTGPNHLPRIDILRAIAILMVFSGHFVVGVYGNPGFTWNGPWYHWADNPSPFSIASRLTILNGNLGVALFFVVSGLCIRLSHLSTSTFSTLHFYWRRFWRIYPPYLLALVLFASIQHSATVRDIVAHLFLVHNFSMDLLGSINGPFWSLALEFQVYLLYPVLLLLHKRFGPLLTGVAFFLVSVLCSVIGGESFRTHFHLPGWFLSAKFLPLTLWFTWYLGFLVAEVVVARKAISMPWRVVLLVSVCLFPFCRLYRPLAPLSNVVGGIMLALAVWEFLSWNTRSQPSFFGKAVAALGACSYSYYLYFDQLIHPCLDGMRWFGITSSETLAVVGYPVTLLAIFAISHLGYRTVEMKSLALGRRYYEKWLKPRREKEVAAPGAV